MASSVVAFKVLSVTFSSLSLPVFFFIDVLLCSW